MSGVCYRRRFVVFSAGAVFTPRGRWVARTLPAVCRLRDMGYDVVLHNPRYETRLLTLGRQCFTGVHANLEALFAPGHRVVVHVVGAPDELLHLPTGRVAAARVGLLEPTQDPRLGALFASIRVTPLDSAGDLPALLEGAWRHY